MLGSDSMSMGGCRQVLQDALILLTGLMHEWVTILDEVARGQIAEQVDHIYCQS